MTKKLVIALAAGGTGGHLFPAEAVAEELLARGHAPLLFTDARFQEFKGVFAQIETITVPASRLGKGLLGKWRFGTSLVRGMFAARTQLKKRQPHAVVGFGGYPSFPTMKAATWLNLRTMIHEQNAVLGRANRMLAAKVYRVATSFEETRGLLEVDKERIVLTGNPVRSGVRAIREVPYPALSQDGALRVLVTGGSQGAHVFSDILPAAMALLPEGLRSRIRLDQQCRAEDLEKARAAYEKIGMRPDLSPFFADIPARLAAAHLVICRAGASTIAELQAAGRPGVYVPLPTAMDDHQTVNANAVEDAGAGWLMPQEAFTPEAVSGKLERFLHSPQSLEDAAAKARARGRPDAAKRLVDAIEKLAA
ncbi:MAG: undecaprenyldiphospho-muramoylpentapeptide beta-N-acetylglucosaminyltransferase [Alphaproteobacteria bacterium]|nr:undecaprenyldiphospho-muramoylpentapeptide beta-N-acetylglucosaminyltransferase [Alphaproteobacteria bacterium]